MMKVLVLSCNTGEGHNSAARAIMEQLEENKTPCEMVDALSFASVHISRFICKSYVNMTIMIPNAFGAGYEFMKDISSTKRKSIVYLLNKIYAKKLKNYIESNGFDTVISTHLFPTECLTYISKKYRTEFKSYFISTDYTCHPLVEETDADYYFIPHKSLVDEFAGRGIPKEKLVPTGIPVLKKYITKIDKDQARQALGLDTESRVILIMTGSMGYGHITGLIKQLLSRIDKNTKILILGGNNEKMKKELRKKFAGNKNVSVLDFTRQVNIYMDAADMLFTKPGGLTSTEAAVKNIPIIHTLPIPGCETYNYNFFYNLGISLKQDKSETSIDDAVALLYDEQRKSKMLELQSTAINKYAARDIVDFMTKNSAEN